MPSTSPPAIVLVPSRPSGSARGVGPGSHFTPRGSLSASGGSVTLWRWVALASLLLLATWSWFLPAPARCPSPLTPSSHSHEHEHELPFHSARPPSPLPPARQSLASWFREERGRQASGEESVTADGDTSIDHIDAPPPAPPRRRENVRVQNMLPFVTTPGDSTGVMLSISSAEDDPSGDSFHYELCSFTHVCASSGALHLFVQSEAEYVYLDSLAAQCNGPDKYRAPNRMFGPCHCFYPQMKLQLLPFWRNQSSDADAAKVTPRSDATRMRQTSVNPLAHMNEGHYFGVHKYVRPHHIAHWAQKLLLFQSAMQHAHSFPALSTGAHLALHSWDPRTLNPTTSFYTPDVAWGGLDGMAVLDTDLPLSDHEAGILNVTLRAVLEQGDHPGLKEWIEGGDAGVREGSERRRRFQSSPIAFAQELDDAAKRASEFWSADSARLRALQNSPSSASAALPSLPPASHMQCYERLTFTRAFGIFSTSTADTSRFRRVAYERLGLSSLLQSRCPPRDVVLLYRSNRGILNWKDVARVVREETGREAKRVTISGANSHEEQASLFARAGLLLSSHSSQLVNVAFTHPHASMIEVSAEFYNADFSEYAHGMGVFFRYALGGEVEGGFKDPGIQACVETLSVCDGDSLCILRERFRCGRRSFANKNLNFHANLTAVRSAVRQAVRHMNWACGGKW